MKAKARLEIPFGCALGCQINENGENFCYMTGRTVSPVNIFSKIVAASGYVLPSVAVLTD